MTGKTVQIAAFLGHLGSAKYHVFPSLVVVPNSTLQSELDLLFYSASRIDELLSSRLDARICQMGTPSSSRAIPGKQEVAGYHHQARDVSSRWLAEVVSKFGAS